MIIVIPTHVLLATYPCLVIASNLVYGCWWVVTIESGPPNFKGQYEEVHDTKNAKTAYRNEASGAMLQFDSDRSRWILVFDDNKGQEHSRHVYWSTENADRDVPWSASGEMSGTSWQVDIGTALDSDFKFKGMHASATQHVH